MESVRPLENGTRWAKAIQYAIASVYLLAPISYWGYSIYLGERVDMLIWVLVLALTIASAYLVFGKSRVEEALSQAEEMAGQGGES